MHWLKGMALGSLLAVCFFLSACATHSSLQQTTACFNIGQEWSYDHRQQDTDSKVVIVDVMMNRNKQRFYVVRVTGVNIEHPHFQNYFPDRVPYFFISEKGLKASLRTLIGEATWNPHFDRYYQKWRRESTGNDYFGLTIKDKIKTLAEVLDVKLGA